MKRALATSTFVCSQCGHEESRWLGRCPDCGSWNTFEEVLKNKTKKGSAHGPRSRSTANPIQLKTVEAEDDITRLKTGSLELDRVLGGGFVPGSLILIGGEPGIGKSTLLLQVLFRLASMGLKVLYVSGEESPGQIRMRAQRLQSDVPELLWLLAETDILQVEKAIFELSPDFIVIDSIQTMISPDIQSAPGTVSQVREASRRLMEIAKGGGAPVAIVGHVTKEGVIAGPRVLEHMVDTVLLFEGQRTENFRLLRTVKNRFGATHEVGVFEMTESGLRDVPNPSEFFLSLRPSSVPGSVIVPVMQGTRPILVEIQALVSHSYLAVPRRTTIGIDSNRLALMLAILEKRLDMPFFDKDVFVNVVGGMKIQETATDLALCLSLVSSLRDQPLPNDMIVFGEVGLSGEIRPVSFWDLRINEAQRLGFSKALIPFVDMLREDKTQENLVGVTGLREAIEVGFA